MYDAPFRAADSRNNAHAGQDSPDALAGITDAGTLILDWNLEIVAADPGSCRMLGRERRLLVGRNCIELVTTPREMRETFDELRRRPGECRAALFGFLRLDGSVLHAHAQLQSVDAPSLGRPCIALTLQDQGRRDRLRAELRARLAQLEQLNARVQNGGRQLQHAERMSAVGEVTAGVAAALQEPTGALDDHLRALEAQLAVLLALTAAGSEAAAALPAAHPARVAFDAQHRLAGPNAHSAEVRRRVDESRLLLARQRRLSALLGRMARGALETWQSHDLRASLEAAVALLAQQFRPRVRFVADLQALPPVYCVPAELDQVLLNLLLNAAQAIDGEHGTVHVRGRPDGEHAVIEVTDDGHGIAAEHRAQLFKPMFTTRANGSGLGLSLAKDVVERHGGRIEVDSTPGVGSRFTVIVPLDLRQAQMAA